MPTQQEIIQRGYFPKELPPPFTTAKFAAEIATLQKTTSKDSNCLRFSNSNYSTLRRTLSIPNPAHFGDLAKLVENLWSDIVSHCSNSRLSRTTPKADVVRAIVGKNTLDTLPSARAEIRTGARYILQADVSQYFENLYTHAIPWAFHTKQVAKINRRNNLFGNELDEASRKIQSGQTIGIPIGPDTSFVIGESVLCAVDGAISASLRAEVSGFRFVDDYEFACSSLEDAEHTRSVVQDALAEYELQLNPRKTHIAELPVLFDTSWVHDLSSYNLQAKTIPAREAQLLRYFGRAFELAQKHAGEPVMKYAVRRLLEVPNGSFVGPTQILLQRLLFQAATIDPGTLHTVLYIAFEIKRNRGSNAVDLDALTRALSAIIVRHAPLQHGGDVAWALWGAIVFGIKLGNAVVESLDRLTDPISVLLALHAENESRFSKPLNRSRWVSSTNPSDLFESHWMLTYEGTGNNWLVPVGGDPALTDPFFADARAKGIHFYDVNMAHEIPKPSLAGNY